MNTKGELPGNFTPGDFNNLVSARNGELSHWRKMVVYRGLPGGEAGDTLIKLADQKAAEPDIFRERMEAYRKGVL